MEPKSKTVELKDGTTVAIRHLDRRDGPALLAFFRALPDDDLLFSPENVTRAEVIERLIENSGSGGVFCLVAEKDDAIVGEATLHFNEYGWQRNMAEIRCVVARDFQHKGLGTHLTRDLVAYADMRGIKKISAKTMDVQKAAQNALSRLGFKKEYELKDFVIDLSGKPHTLVIMINDVDRLWKTMEDLLVYSDHEPWKMN